jgi:hypothetical protein
VNPGGRLRTPPHLTGGGNSPQALCRKSSRGRKDASLRVRPGNALSPIAGTGYFHVIRRACGPCALPAKTAGNRILPAAPESPARFVPDPGIRVLASWPLTPLKSSIRSPGGSNRSVSPSRHRATVSSGRNNCDGFDFHADVTGEAGGFHRRAGWGVRGEVAGVDGVHGGEFGHVL